MRIVIESYYSDKTFHVTFEELDLLKCTCERCKIIVPYKYAFERSVNYEIDDYSGALECAFEAYLNRKESEHEIRYHGVLGY